MSFAAPVISSSASSCRCRKAYDNWQMHTPDSGNAAIRHTWKPFPREQTHHQKWPGILRAADDLIQDYQIHILLRLYPGWQKDPVIRMIGQNIVHGRHPDNGADGWMCSDIGYFFPQTPDFPPVIQTFQILFHCFNHIADSVLQNFKLNKIHNNTEKFLIINKNF